MTLDTSSRQEVTLKQELEILQKYLAIEQTRFGKRLDVAIHVDPEALDARVPSLLLQPLAENAIRHGVAPHARQGRVAVHASRDRGHLILEVRDSGDGLPPERLSALNRGVGLRNTRARLEHLYPGAHQFSFTNLPDGFSVAVRIPFQQESTSLAFAQAGAA
jgi:two-component system, LytTR family, sensor kinase